MIRINNPRTKLPAFIAMMCAILLLALSAPLQAATSILNVDANTTFIDLTDFGKAITPDKNIVTVQGPGDAQPVDLKAKGEGPTYFWSLYSIHNSSDVNLDFALAVEPQRFAGSGLLKLVPVGNSALGAMATAGPDIITPLAGADQKAFAFRLNAGQSLNIALESSGATLNANLWQRQSFEDHLINFSFFRGLVLGVAFLVTLGILALYSFRPHASLLAGWFFAFASLIFIVFETGVLSNAVQQLPKFELAPPVLRALVENLLTTALLLCVLAFTDIRRRKPVLGFGLLLFLTALVANFIFAFVDANHASSFARLGFACNILLGFTITASSRKTVSNIVDSGFLFWLSIGAWAIFAGIVTQSESRTANLSPALTAGLTAVLVALTMVLLRYVFSQGLSAKPFITDASRRSLALTSARHILWDWQVQDRYLDIGEELPKALGYDPRDWSRHAEQSFVEIMHPVDAAVYQAELEGGELLAGHHIDLDLRLRNAEGDYRWYELRSRIVPGPNQLPDRCIGTLTDVTKIKETEERLLIDAVHDPVTGLPSRALFMDRAERELNKPIGLQLRFILIDLDRFKILNEALGHDQGDRLLQTAGERIQDCLSDDESVARVSGSQFAVLAIESLAQRSAQELAELILAALDEPVSFAKQEITLTASIGISNASERGVTTTDMQQQAASALLEARRLGGSQIVVFDKSLKDDRASDLEFESDLRRAMISDEIEVHFQPISRLDSLEIAGLEALARWRHPSKGLLPPLEFINIAEQAGMIGEIGQIVLSTAARQLGVWQRVQRRDENFFVSVNISPSHFLEMGFLEQVQTIIEREGLKPNSLKIEVTESVIMRHPERATRLFERLRALGVGLACDDFGTGYSNLSSIRDLPFDTLKIDRSFLTPESFDTRSSMIITTITELAHGLGMVVVAEGIETQNQIDRMAELGCDLGQGYLIGEPMAAREISELLSATPKFNVNMPVPIAAPTPEPGLAPMAPRTRSLFDPPVPELEVLPSIFSLQSKPKPVPQKKTKAKTPAKRPAKKPAKKITKAR
jgi:diguanylate cyclase (GGDEF)-like protein